MKRITAFIAATILSLTISVPVLAEPVNNSITETSVSQENEDSSGKESTTKEEVYSESSFKEKSNEESSVEEKSNRESSVEEKSVEKESKEISYTSYAVPEAEMYISFPDDMYVITRTIDEKSPILKAYKLTKEDLLKNFNETNTYIKASASDFTYDITVNVLKNDDTKTIGNISSLEDSDIQSIVNNMLMQPIYTGCSRTKYNNTLYLTFPMEYDSGKTKVKGIQEYTIVRGARIVITFQSYIGEIDKDLDNIITETMNSVIFDGINPNPETSKQQLIYVNNLDIRYIYLIIASILAIIFLMLIIITAMKYKKSKKLNKKTDFLNSVEEEIEDFPQPVEEKIENIPEHIEEEQGEIENITEIVEEIQEKIDESSAPIEEKQEEIENMHYPVVENQLEIVEIALRIIPELKPEFDDDTEIWNFIYKKTADMEFFANHSSGSYSNANAFYRINANSNILNTPKATETIDDAIRKETLETIVGNNKPEILEFEKNEQSEGEIQDFNELEYSIPENKKPVSNQDVFGEGLDNAQTDPKKLTEHSKQEKIMAMDKSEMKLGDIPKRPKNEIYKADEEVPKNQAIQLEISKSSDGSIKIGANNGTKSLDIEIKDASKPK